MRILLVCLGNICRSAAAEGVLRAKAPHLTLDSAGTSNWHIGDAPYGPMQAAAGARGLDLSAQKARQFTATDFHNFDLIVAMDAQNRADIELLRPEGALTLVQLFGPSDVPDPYYTRDFDGCLDIIEGYAAQLISDTTPQRSG